MWVFISRGRLSIRKGNHYLTGKESFFWKMENPEFPERLDSFNGKGNVKSGGETQLASGI
jgi:hypothetical protein